MFGILRAVRGVAGFIFALQIIGLFPVLTWFADVGAITGEMLAKVTLKIITCLIFGFLFFWLRGVINRRHEKKFGTPHPSLATKRLAL
jgi:hypothetical protein